MKFGQHNREYEKNSIPMDPGFITRSLAIFVKYEVVLNDQCMDEVEEEYYATPWHRALRMSPKKRTVLRPSLRVFMRDHQLICHPLIGENLEKRLRDFTASLLDTVE